MLEHYASSHTAAAEGNSLAANSLLEISYQKLEPFFPGCWARERDTAAGGRRCFWRGGLQSSALEWQFWDTRLLVCAGELQAGLMPFSVLFNMPHTPHTPLSHIYKYYKAICDCWSWAGGLAFSGGQGLAGTRHWQHLRGPINCETVRAKRLKSIKTSPHSR